MEVFPTRFTSNMICHHYKRKGAPFDAPIKSIFLALLPLAPLHQTHLQQWMRRLVDC